ncbi:MAG TPA: trigger factor [Ruminococcaceae bacterium]|nr:trigger factor [Oscillospiraceae bacterium]
MSLESSNKVDTNRYQLEVKVDADKFEGAVNKAYLKNRNKIMIPGFRKGKAPRKFIEKYYGEKVFYDDAINDVYPDALEEAIKESELGFVEDKIDFDLVSADKDGLKFKATITTKPEVQIEGYKGIKVEKEIPNVTDGDVDKELENIRERDSRMVTVDDRTAQKGDIAVIDFDGYADGERFEGGKGENYSLTLGSGQFINGFEDQVIGHKTGEEFDVNVKFPDDYGEKSLAGRDSVFKVKLHEIKVKELPQLDDDFVKDVSEFDTLDEYKADIKKNIEKRKEDISKDKVDNQLIDKVNELLKADIPEAMFRNRVDDDLKDFSYRLQSQGMNIQKYMQYTGENEEAIRKRFRPQAERQVKFRLALEKIAELEAIKPTEEDLEKEYKKYADAYKIDQEKIKKLIKSEDLSKDIAVEKAFDVIRDSAEVTEVPEKTGEGEKKAEADESGASAD